MEADEKRDIMLLVAFAEITGKPVTPWEAHAALLRAHEVAESYARGDHPQRTRDHVKNWKAKDVS